jgi:hypothetical protein
VRARSEAGPCTCQVESSGSMNEASERTELPRPAAVVLGLFVVLSGILLTRLPGIYPQLHTVLDTSSALLSAVVAILLWDMGKHTQTNLPKWVAISFAVVSRWSLSISWWSSNSPGRSHRSRRQKRTSGRSPGRDRFMSCQLGLVLRFGSGSAAVRMSRGSPSSCSSWRPDSCS